MRKLNKDLRKRMFLLTVLTLCAGAIALPTQAAKKNAWTKKAGKTYYYDKKGKKATGLKTIKGRRYFFDKKGVLYKKGWKTVKGKKYYFKKKNGAAATGAVKIGKKRYLFNDKGQLAGTGLQKYGKKRYYTKKGVIQTGLKTVKRKTYYFTAKGPAATGWKTVKGKKYYFGSNGAAATGKQTIEGKTYQFSKKGALQKEMSTTPAVPEKKPDATQMPETGGTVQKPERPVEPEVQDPSVKVPVVNPVENTKENMQAAYSKLNQAINQSKTYVESWNTKDWEPTGYQNFMAVFEEAKAMFHVTDLIIKEDSEWKLVFDASKGTFVSKQREFNPANYPYTATELLQEAEKLKAYEEQCLSLQKEQVLTYWPEQSRAIFDAINEYRVSKGVEPLIWGDDASKNARLESGYCVYIYKGTNDEEDLKNFQNHSGGQNGAYKTAGQWGVKECVQAWINSPGHEGFLRDPSNKYGAVAYYTYNSATTGIAWNAVIFDAGVQEVYDDYMTHAPEELWSMILNCETNNIVIP